MANFTPQEIEQFLQEFFDTVGARQYIGARYIPIFGRAGSDTVEWDDLAPYEPLTVVMHEGVSYVSRRYVPRGIQITDTQYWAQTYRFNAQVEQYRQEVLGFQDQIDQVREDMESDYVPFPDSVTYPKYGLLGQVLTTLTNGETKWENPVVPSDAQAEEVITAWLNDHPEATTTVQDGSITLAKLNNNLATNLYQRAISAPSNDVNDFMQIGGYLVETSYAHIPSNMNSGGTLHVLNYSNTRRLQLLVNLSGQMWFRTYGTQDGNFSDWYQIAPSYVATVPISSTDVNDFTAVGGYLVNTTYSNIPEDMSSNGTLHCFNIGSTRKLQIIAVGGNNPQLYFRTWGSGTGAYTEWLKLFPIPTPDIPDPSDTVTLAYSSANNYVVDLGTVTLALKHDVSTSTDSDLWNVLAPTLKATNTQIDSGDIIGPIRVDGASDFTFGVHGSSTTTLFAAYMDGVRLTLGSSTNVTGKELVIFMHDEGRHPDNMAHIFDRDVTIRLTKNRMWVSNTIKNVSGQSLNIASACNGGLMAAFVDLINGISTNVLVNDSPLTANTPYNNKMISCTFALNGCTMTARNILGHELSDYNANVVVYSGNPGRNKAYFYTALNHVMAANESIAGEFVYEYR